ncbi:LOW QUALITY PROTEIN: hypothetical protein Cgig2_019376 [Carnegiea gigantea]|uniref:Uncharacterized protein n=1 Tax=Carnegiea gigantea TaxID=171969 RepID=A0A9Q1KCM2_9CARY|nr:LOW QUALITY PROTEIN: hypothetical protein Cgig2_019376 [Carnegiea gigantea]
MIGTLPSEQSRQNLAIGSLENRLRHGQRTRSSCLGRTTSISPGPGPHNVLSIAQNLGTCPIQNSGGVIGSNQVPDSGPGYKLYSNINKSKAKKLQWTGNYLKTTYLSNASSWRSCSFLWVGLIIFSYYWSSGHFHRFCELIFLYCCSSETSCRVGLISFLRYWASEPSYGSGLIIYLSCWSSEPSCRLNHLLLSLEQRTLVQIKLNHLSLLLDQRTLMLNHLPASFEQQTFLWVKLNYVHVSMEQRNLHIRLNHVPLTLEQRTFLWIRLNYLPVLLEQQMFMLRTFMCVRPTYLHVTLEQRTFMWVRLIIFLCCWSSVPLCGLGLIIFLCRWSNEPSCGGPSLIIFFEPSCVLGLIIFLCHYNSRPFYRSGLIIFLYRWSSEHLHAGQANLSSYITRAATLHTDLFTGHVDFMDKMLKLLVSSNAFARQNRTTNSLKNGLRPDQRTQSGALGRTRKELIKRELVGFPDREPNLVLGSRNLPRFGTIDFIELYPRMQEDIKEIKTLPLSGDLVNGIDVIIHNIAGQVFACFAMKLGVAHSHKLKIRFWPKMGHNMGTTSWNLWSKFGIRLFRGGASC